jgi:hypothetical protein
MVLAQDQAQRSQSTAPQEARDRKAKYDADLLQYQKDLQKYNTDTTEYEKALTAYENEVSKQAALKKANDDKVAAEKAKIAADQKRLTDVQAAGNAKVNVLIAAKNAAMAAVPYTYQQTYMTGSGGGFVQNDGTDVQRVRTVAYTKSQRSVMVNAVVRNHNSGIEALQRQNSIAYQQTAFSINYPDAGALGGSWFRAWKSNPHGSSLSSRYESELSRRQTQAQRSRELSIKQAQSNAIIAAKQYSVDVKAYSGTITNFGGTDIREFSKKELARRSEIKPLPPTPIPTINGRTLTKSTNREPQVGFKFETITAPESKQDKQEKALSDFYDSYKSTSKAPATVLTAAVINNAGSKPTLKTQGMIDNLTKNQSYTTYDRTATYSITKPTGEKRSFDAKTGLGDAAIGASLGYHGNQNMQEPTVNSSDKTATYFLVNTSLEKPKPQSLINRSITAAIGVLEKESNNPNKHEPIQAVPRFLEGLAYGGLVTVGAVSNLWESKVETFNLRGTPNQNILAPKFEYEKFSTGYDKDGNPKIKSVISPYLALESVGGILKSNLLNAGGYIQFDKPYQEEKQVALPQTTAFGEAMTLNPSNVIDYANEKGIAWTTGEFSEIFVGGLPRSGTSLPVKLTIQEAIQTGIKPNTLFRLYKQESLAGGQLVKKSAGERVSDLFHLQTIKDKIVKPSFLDTIQNGNNKIPKWQIDDIAKSQDFWKKLTPMQQSKALQGQADNAAKLSHNARYKGYMEETQLSGYGKTLQHSYTPNSKFDVNPQFISRSAPLGTSLAGVITKGEITKPRPLSTLYDELPYKPANRANEIDLLDEGTWKPTFDYTPVSSTKPTVPKSVEPKAPTNTSNDDFSKMFTSKSATPTKRFKTDSEIEKDVKAAGGTIDKNGQVTITKQESKVTQKTTQKQTQSQIIKPKSSFDVKIQQQKTKLKTKLKSKQIYSVLPIYAVVQAQKQNESYRLDTLFKQKQTQKQQQKQQYKQQQKQQYKQVQAYKYKFDQPQMYKQATQQKTTQLSLYKQTPKLKLNTKLQSKLKSPTKLKTKTPLRILPPKESFIGRTPTQEKSKRIIPAIPDEKKRLKKTTTGKQSRKLFIGNVSEIQVEGIYNRSNITRGKKRVMKLHKKDLFGIGAIRKASDKVSIF